MTRKIELFVAAFLVIIVGVPVCFIGAMTFIFLVSPSFGSDDDVAIFVAILSVLAVVCSCVVWLVASLKGSKSNNIAIEKPKDDESSLRLDIQDFRRRGRWYRLMSMFVLFLMVAVALVGFTVASTSASSAQQSPGGEALAALVLVVLTRILASIYRYNLRLSSFYDARADYLYLTDDVKALSHKELLKLVGTDELDITSTRKFWYSLFRSRARRRNGVNRNE